jgi:hypothetical protein
MANKSPENSEFDELPSPEDFCLTVPIYDEFRYNIDESNPFFGLEHFKGSLDCYCHGCGRHTVFNKMGEPNYREHHHRRNYILSLWFSCSRDQNHQACFIFHSNDGILKKIGQFPSLADLATPDLQKYRPVLGNDGFRELTRAVGLASHGVGVGAFVYLRRRFESLIEKAREEASKEKDWDEETYQRARMDEKISILKNHLPTFLVQNRSLYGIMSVGVHTLSENECLEAFPIVRVGIELMLDEHLERHAREKKIAAATKGISALGKSLKENETT